MLNSINQIITEETKKRINIMNSLSYIYPDNMLKIDYILIFISITISLILIILCMTGVII